MAAHGLTHVVPEHHLREHGMADQADIRPASNHRSCLGPAVAPAESSRCVRKRGVAFRGTIVGNSGYRFENAPKSRSSITMPIEPRKFETCPDWGATNLVRTLSAEVRCNGNGGALCSNPRQVRHFIRVAASPSGPESRNPRQLRREIARILRSGSSGDPLSQFGNCSG